MSLKETYYSYPTSSPYFFIDAKCALLQYLAVYAVGFSPLPPKKKLKFKDYDSNNFSQCGYDSDNHFVNFLDDVPFEEDCYTGKGLTYYMTGESRDGNETRDDSDKLLLLING